MFYRPILFTHKAVVFFNYFIFIYSNFILLKVLENGDYIKPQNSKLIYGAMVMIRVGIVIDCFKCLSMAIVIAIRYSAVRRQTELTPGFVYIMLNKRQRIPKGQSKIDNPEKLATYGTQDTRRRQTKQKHYTQTNTNNVNETQALLQTTGG